MNSTGKKTLALIFVILLLAPLPSLFAQSGEDLTIKVALIGPGSELYFWWGHIALVIEDNRTGQSRFFDWGVFSFDTENFFTNFAFGRLIYTSQASPTHLNFDVYIRTNRSVILYTLDLPPETKLEVLRFAEASMNQDYLYHHFRKNCATKIRDIIDMATGGQFKAAFGEMPGRFTLRQHVRRHTWFNPFFDWLLNFWMGQNIDGQITVWDEMFLPSEITKRIRDFSFIDADGGERNLVSNVETFFASQGRPAVLDIPRLQWPRTLIFSVSVSALFLLALFFFAKHKAYRICMGLMQSLLGLFFGITGSMLFFMSFFTYHDYTFNNINIVFVNPLFLALVPLGIIFAFTAAEKKRIAVIRIIKFFWGYVFLGAFVTIVIKVFPAFYQQNQVDLALIMPLALAMIMTMIRLGEVSRQRYKIERSLYGMARKSHIGKRPGTSRRSSKKS